MSREVGRDIHRGTQRGDEIIAWWCIAKVTKVWGFFFLC